MSPEVAAVRAELLARGVIVLDEDPRKGEKVLHVASYVREWAEEAVPELLGAEWEVCWIAKTPREIVPARILSYRDRGMGGMKLFIPVADEEHVDEVLVAEDDEKVVVAAYVCSPALPKGRRHRIEAAKVYAAQSLDERPVIDRFTGEVLVNESLLDE